LTAQEQAAPKATFKMFSTICEECGAEIRHQAASCPRCENSLPGKIASKTPGLSGKPSSRASLVPRTAVLIAIALAGTITLAAFLTMRANDGEIRFRSATSVSGRVIPESDQAAATNSKPSI
jgi:ribosomal protein L40E